MIENVKVKYVDWLADSISELVTRCCESDGEYYTICLNVKHSEEKLRQAYTHALSHITGGDFDNGCNVSQLEKVRHDEV